jgi:hypothetical protein
VFDKHRYSRRTKYDPHCLPGAAASQLVAPCSRPARPPDRIVLGRMRKSFAAPRTIRRIAAQRAFGLTKGKRVVLTIGVPQPVPGSDWGCPLQITGLNTGWRRPRYVFGIDGLQALHLAMKCATDVLASAESDLEWLGQKGDVMLPRFLPDLPRQQQALLEAIVQRETLKYLKSVERAHKAKHARTWKRRQR